MTDHTAELAAAGLRHADGISAQLSKPDWKPERVHIEMARNSIRKLSELLRQSGDSRSEVQSGEANWAIFDQAMMLLEDVPGETLLERVSRMKGWHVELCSLHGNEVNRSIDLEMERDRLLDPAQARPDRASPAFGYALRLLEHFVAEHFPHNPDWKPCEDLMGVLTQLDNAITIARDYKEKLRAYEGPEVPSAEGK